MHWRSLVISAFILGSALGAASAAAPPTDAPRVRLIPQYTQGQTLYYQFETRTHTAGHTTSAIKDPEGPSQLDQSSTFLVRLDVLDVKLLPQGAAGGVRLRFTYQKVTVSTQSDAYDPQVDANEAQLRGLEGKSLEFTVASDGEVRDVTGVDAIVPNPTIAASMRGWMSSFASTASFPKNGIIVGEKWTSVRPLPDIPLAGVVSRKVSTYLRDEPCGAAASLQNDAASPQGAADASHPNSAAAAAAPSAAAPEPEMCAVILTKFEIARDRKTASTTPETYRKNGLHTKGKWTGSGEGLDSISLRTGLVHSETQNSTQDMDFTISSETAPSQLTYAGNVKSQTQITLLPENQAPTPSEPKQ
jgi:hypothetical protein